MAVGPAGCRPLTPREAVELALSRGGPRLASSLSRLLRLLSAVAGELGVEEVIIYGSLADPGRPLRVDSDVDVLVVARRGDAHGALAKLVPEVVRLKRLPGGGVDAHTQLIDYPNAVLWHVVTARPGRLGEKLPGGPCLSVSLVETGSLSH
ncbi:MAG: hypothetical protein LRS49_06520 [Desulfurococcales archaeon]|nr:hypothetical protein [Desulfurococcales archaeon]